MRTDPRKVIADEFLSDAPGRSDCVDQCLLDGHYRKSLLAAIRSLDNTLTDEDRSFIHTALQNYAGMLLERNFWNLAHLAKERPISEFDPALATAIYRTCVNVDELRSLLYFDSAKSAK